MLTLLTLLLVFILPVHSAPAPRNVYINGQNFVHASNPSKAYIMRGPNVVVKGPPYLPSTDGNTICNDTVNSECRATGTCITCFTFNQADADHVKAMGWNTIRLGITWAGAQPTDDDVLDSEFVTRLHDILALCEKNDINVVLDNHGDMVGTAGRLHSSLLMAFPPLCHLDGTLIRLWKWDSDLVPAQSSPRANRPTAEDRAPIQLDFISSSHQAWYSSKEFNPN